MSRDYYLCGYGGFLHCMHCRILLNAMVISRMCSLMSMEPESRPRRRAYQKRRESSSLESVSAQVSQLSLPALDEGAKLFCENHEKAHKSRIESELQLVRKNNADPNKIGYPIEVKATSLWDATLILSSEQNNFCKKVAPCEFYKISLSRAVKSIYKCLKTFPAQPADAIKDIKREHLQMRYLHAGKEFEIEGASHDAFMKAIHLLALYSQADSRFSQLASIITEWKRMRFDPIDQTGAFSSYAIMLMLVQYLQVGCDPPVLPCLHDDHPNIFKTSPDLFALSTNSRSKFKSQNKQTLGQLLVGFFSYYAQENGQSFNYRTRMVSVRVGRPVRILGPPSKTFIIEDPITKENIVMDSSGPRRIHPSELHEVVQCYKLTRLNSKNMSEILVEMFALVEAHLINKPDLSALMEYKFD